MPADASRSGKQRRRRGAGRRGATPRPKAQRSFIDPGSRIMVDGATTSFIQAYNAHAAVDEESQVIVAATLTQRANDKQDFLPLLA